MLCIKDLDYFAGALYFTKLDLQANYHQACMATDDTCKTTHKTNFDIFLMYGHSFWPHKCPTTFMLLINDIFQPYLSNLSARDEDLLVFSCTWDEHLQYVHTILDLLCNLNLHVKIHKSSFGETFLCYLRFFIT